MQGKLIKLVKNSWKAGTYLWKWIKWCKMKEHMSLSVSRFGVKTLLQSYNIYNLPWYSSEKFILREKSVIVDRSSMAEVIIPPIQCISRNVYWAQPYSGPWIKRHREHKHGSDRSLPFCSIHTMGAKRDQELQVQNKERSCLSEE